MNELNPDAAEQDPSKWPGDGVVPALHRDRVPVVGIGGSAGSIPALRAFLGAVPPDCGLAFIVVVHLAPEQEGMLASVLQACTTLRVVPVTGRRRIEPECVYVVGPGHALTLEDGTIAPAETLAQRGRRVAVDLLLRVLADTHGARATAVVLSGMNADGAIGIQRVKERGGLVIAQDPLEAEHSDMPEAAIRSGLVDWVLPAAEMPPRICDYHRMQARVRLPAEEGPPAAAAAQIGSRQSRDEQALHDVLAFLRARTGRDFAAYKRATLLRRIGRRMQVCGAEDLEAYLQSLRTVPGEPAALLQDLLISVTNFFRDASCFEALAAHVPRLFTGKDATEVVRVWVPACATGEEAYSVAMLLAEHADRLEDPPGIQVFATDLDAHAIQTARDGFYPATIEADVGPERLRRFFVREGGSYRVRRDLRDGVLFAVHDVLRDSPFSRVDLVSCRNLLIYLQRDAQRLVLETLHFALRPPGMLLLGASETADETSQLFAAIDRPHRLYVRKPGIRTLPVPAHFPAPLATTYLQLIDTAVAGAARPDAVARAPETNAGSWAALHLELLERLGPPSLVVDGEQNVVHLSAHAGRYLQLGGGQPTSNLLRLVHPAFRAELRAAFFQAARERSMVELPPVRVELEGEARAVTVRIVPETRVERELYLVLFDEARVDAAAPAPAEAGAQPHDPARTAEHLDREIERLRSQLRETVEQYEAAHEELKASNEELQAMNEELRSTTEELETGREELQSINEEMGTVNQELKVKVEELGTSNSDMVNLMNATSIPTVFLDRDLKITRYTPAAVGVFNLIPGDVGRPLADLRGALDFPSLEEDAAGVLERLTPVQREVRRPLGEGRDERWFLVRLLPYRTLDDRIAGIVLTLVDITERRTMRSALRASEDRLRLIVENAHDYAIFSTDSERVITTWNRGAERLLGYAESEAVGRSADMIFTPEDRAARAPEREMETALRDGRAGDDRWHLRKDGSRFWASGVMTQLRDDTGRVIGFAKILRDQTEARAAQEALESNRAELLRIGQETEAARREAELQREHLVALFSEAPAPICMLHGHDHVVEFANPRMGQLWGREPARVIGKPLFQAVSRSRVTIAAETLAGVMAEGTPRVVKEVRARLPRGRPGVMEDVHLNFTFAPLHGAGGAIEGVLVMAADVTDEVRARERMSQMHEAEQAASRAKDDFLAMLGHELRNPLAPLRNALHLMRRQRADGEDPILDIAERQSNTLTRLVDDLLDAARVTEGKIDLRLEDVDLAVVVQRALDSVRSMFDARGHEVALELPARPLPAHVDPVRMEQVVLNLLTNAARYTPPKGRIDLALRKMGRMAEIRVTDNGIGISPELRPRLFEIFQQGDRPLARDTGGLGIGLSVVRHLVALHGGNVEARSEGEGKGSTFIVRLPLPTVNLPKKAPKAPRATAAAGAAPAGGAAANADDANVADASLPDARPAPLRVLVVDDNHDAGVTLLMVVEALGHDVRLAHDGPQAVETCAQWHPDIVFLDIGLPGMDGYEVAREIHRRLPDAVPRLVAVTGYGQERDRHKSRAAGFHEHLVKPASFDAIEKIVSEGRSPRARGS